MTGRLRRGAVAAVLAAALVVSGCAVSEPADSRPVTTEESHVLASMRFRNFDAGMRGVEFHVDEGGVRHAFRGWYDFAGHRGYGALTADDGSRVLLAWTDTTVGITDIPSASDTPPLPLPADAEWSTSPIAASSSRLHTILAVITSLGADRPDNPLLLQQSGALWLGTSDVDGTAVTVFAGPPSDSPVEGAQVDPDDSHARYWVDEAGMLQRAEIRLGDGDDWVSIAFAAAEGVDFGIPADSGAQW